MIEMPEDLAACRTEGEVWRWVAGVVPILAEMAEGGDLRDPYYLSDFVAGRRNTTEEGRVTAADVAWALVRINAIRAEGAPGEPGGALPPVPPQFLDDRGAVPLRHLSAVLLLIQPRPAPEGE